MTFLVYNGKKILRGQRKLKKQTFILEIKDTRNQNWQGCVEWVQGRKKESFRSFMEMVNLLDSVMSRGEEKTEFPKE